MSIINQLKIKDLSLKTANIRSFYIQILVFGYALFRYSSRSYEVYGLLDKADFIYPRWTVGDLWAVPPLHLTTLQFIYDFLPYPTPEQIRLLQYLICFLSVIGIFGIAPKISSWGVFILASHIEGLLISSDAEISGATVLLACLLLFCFCPNSAFFSIRASRRYSLCRKTRASTFLVFNYSLILALFYFLPGVNKIIDCGLNWPVTVRLDLLSIDVSQTQYFFNARHSFGWLVSTQTSLVSSIVGGIFTLVAELLAVVFVTNFRYKYLLVNVLILMHFFVYSIAGINFTGNSFLLLGVLGVDLFVAKATVIYDDRCAFCVKSIGVMRRLSPFNVSYLGVSRLQEVEASLGHSIDLVRCKRAICLCVGKDGDSDGDVMYGFNVIAHLLARSYLMPFGILMFFPPFNLLGVVFYYLVSKTRYLIAGTCDDGSCLL